MPRETLTLGLLPEPKRKWGTFLVSYTGCAIIVLLLLCIHLIWFDRMSVWEKYTVTEIIPLPNQEHHAPKPQPKPIKPLPVVKFEQPKLVVPKEMQRQKKEEAKFGPQKNNTTNFEAQKWQPVAGVLPANIVHTGSFGSSATPTVNAPIEKVQTGGFGDPNG